MNYKGVKSGACFFRVKNGIITKADEGFIELFGLNENGGAIEGRLIKEILPGNEALFDGKFNPDEWSAFKRATARINGQSVELLANFALAGRENDGDKLVCAFFSQIQTIDEYEEKLRESEEKYRTLFEKNPDGIMITDPELLRVEFANPAICEMLGYERDFLEGISIKGEASTPVFKTARDAVARVAAGEKGVKADVSIRHKNGELRDFETTGEIIAISGKKYVMAIFRDVTDARKAEKELSESHERERFLTEILDKSSVAFGVGYPDGGIGYFNKASCDALGYSEEELREIGWSEDLTPPEWRAQEAEALAELITTGRPVCYEKEYIKKNGERIPVELWAHVVKNEDGDPLYFYSFIADISERKRVEKALKESHERVLMFAEIIKSSSQPFAMGFPDGRTGIFNKAMLDLIGYDLDEILTMDWRFDLSPPEYSQTTLEAMEKAVKTGSPVKYEKIYRRKDGGLILIESHMHALLNDKGEPKLFYSFINDISKQRDAEDALRASEERYRLLVEMSPDAIAVHHKGIVEFANKAALQLFKAKSMDQVVGKQLLSFVHPDYRGIVAERVRLMADEGQFVELMEEKMICLDGTVIETEVTAGPFDFGGKRSIIVMLRDVTAKRMLEQEMQKSQKLESLGLLAGGIAHDFNNLLTGIQGNIYLARKAYPVSETASARLLQAEKAVERAKRLTAQLLTFSRGGAPVKHKADMREIVKETAEFALRGSAAALEFDMPGDLWAASVDVGQIGQVIHNIVVNAEQAMPDGGKIKIAASNCEAGGEMPALKPGAYVRVSVSDEGCGIPPENVEKIFDPYFTTKSKGSGLGLTVCHSIVKKHDGLILAESESGRGTVFSIYLPALKDAVIPHPTLSESETVVRGSGRILIMDDDELVLDAGREIFRELGYEVETARDGKEAVEKYGMALQLGKKFDAVVLDLTVPGGSGGKETIRRLLEMDPAAKAVVSSGYSNDPIMADYAAYGFREVIVKPYDAHAASRVISKIVKTN